jgi:hypothetical protein
MSAQRSTPANKRNASKKQPDDGMGEWEEVKSRARQGRAVKEAIRAEQKERVAVENAQFSKVGKAAVDRALAAQPKPAPEPEKKPIEPPKPYVPSGGFASLAAKLGGAPEIVNMAAIRRDEARRAELAKRVYCVVERLYPDGSEREELVPCFITGCHSLAKCPAGEVYHRMEPLKPCRDGATCEEFLEHGRHRAQFSHPSTLFDTLKTICKQGSRCTNWSCQRADNTPNHSVRCPDGPYCWVQNNTANCTRGRHPPEYNSVDEHYKGARMAGTCQRGDRCAVPECRRAHPPARGQRLCPHGRGCQTHFAPPKTLKGQTPVRCPYVMHPPHKRIGLDENGRVYAFP